MTIKKGDFVKIVNCAEADIYGHLVFEVCSEPWNLGHGAEVIKIKNHETGKCFSSFCTDFLCSAANPGEKLKPCPCCGSDVVQGIEVKHDVSGDFGHQILCLKCGNRSGFRYRNQEAIAAWNTRAEPVGKFDRLRKWEAGSEPPDGWYWLQDDFLHAPERGHDLGIVKVERKESLDDVICPHFRSLGSLDIWYAFTPKYCRSRESLYGPIPEPEV